MCADFKTVRGNLVDLHQKRIYPAELQIQNRKISSIKELPSEEKLNTYILPGFVDAHIHIESSMLVPSAFAAVAVKHGSLATVSDPHEIANVLGVAGVEYMIEDAARVPFKFNFGAPSCVPATTFETAGASINAKEVGELLARPEIKYLSEMMNYPGVLHRDAEVMAKIAHAKALDKPIDGHAPGLTAEAALAYIAAGISTDHECFTLEEALFKAENGMKILIREGSAARNFEALHPLLGSHPHLCMFCSDDKHPDELLEGHINVLVQRALALGYNYFDVLRVACVNPVEHYQLHCGLLREGDWADFIEVNHPTELKVLAVYIDGQLVFNGNNICFEVPEAETPNRFNIMKFDAKQLALKVAGRQVQLIEARDGQLITGRSIHQFQTMQAADEADQNNDILKLVVVNRYKEAPPAVAFIKGFGLKNAAIAGTVAHDSHNIVAVGSNDTLLAKAIDLVIAEQGGLSFTNGECNEILPLPVAGLMSTASCEAVGAAYGLLDQLSKQAGSNLRAPYMTLSFMALLVIPDIKLSDLGLFDGQNFEFTPLLLTP
ncbi:MAG: adenine deaminase [Bacteroidia bacterium]